MTNINEILRNLTFQLRAASKLVDTFKDQANDRLQNINLALEHVKDLRDNYLEFSDDEKEAEDYFEEMNSKYISLLNEKQSIEDLLETLSENKLNVSPTVLYSLDNIDSPFDQYLNDESIEMYTQN